MEAPNYFTSIEYDTVDFLIQSKYVVFGLYLAVGNDEKNIVFNSEKLPHVYIGSYLENIFSCKSPETCNTVLIMRKNDFPHDVQNLIQSFTGTVFPLSGNFALSVNSLISSKDIDIKNLKMIPKSVRHVLNSGGICAIGFEGGTKDKPARKQILLSADSLLRKMLSGNSGNNEGEK
ncbi:MAG: hypothetical protein II821_05380 [Treponema sp.]|nr:hypothetical protein [Treponema sp.]